MHIKFRLFEKLFKIVEALQAEIRLKSLQLSDLTVVEINLKTWFCSKASSRQQTVTNELSSLHEKKREDTSMAP